MLFDDLEPQKPVPKPKQLDGMSVDELRAYIADLQAEIVRVEAAVKAKEAHKLAAAAFFKTP
jgi:uncharacterized small protein (DUF1192 family)